MKIAFVAMSGVRACDPELRRMGLTLPGFAERARTIASLPSLGLLTLAGLTPDRHEIRYIEVANTAAAPPLDDVDVVAISAFSAQIREAYTLADRLRRGGARVVLGGPHASCLPDEAGVHADAVVIGEGELSWPTLLADAESGCLKARYGRLGEPFDLTRAPMPRFDLLDRTRYNRLTVQTSRGCPHRCEFCAATPLMTPGYRQKPTAMVLAEIDRIRTLWPRPFIEFADDNSFVRRDAWRELLPELARRRVRWFTETDIAVADDDAFLAELAASGCAQLLIGLESPVEAGLRDIELRGDWKRRRHAGYRDAVRRIQAHGIGVNGCFIVGLDGHGPDVFDAVFDFVRETELAEAQVTVPTAFPGTAYYARLAAAGRLIEPDAWERCTLFDVNIRPAGMSAEALRDGFRSLIGRLYAPEEVARRRDAFRRQRRLARRRTMLPPTS